MIRLHPDTDLEIRARLLLCDYYSERDGSAAQQQIDAAATLLLELQLQGLRAGVLTCRAETLETAGNYARADAEFDEAQLERSRPRQTMNKCWPMALFSRGYLRALRGEYAAGMSDVRRSQQLFERINMPQHALTVLNSIATIYNRMGEHGQAAQIYERARSQPQHDAGLRRDEAVSLYNLGRARFKLGEWEAARTGYSGCLALSRELKYTRGEAYAMLGLASVDNVTGDPNGALGKLDRGMELQRQSPDARLDAQIQLARGTALQQLQRSRGVVGTQTIRGRVQAGRFARKLGTTYDELATVYAQTGDWRSAYGYRADAQTTSEKLLHSQLDQRFATLKVEFDTAAKEKENALLLSQNALDQKALAQERRANTLQTVVILLSLMLLGLLTTMVLRQRRGARRMHALAMTDEPGLPNRRALLNHLEALLQRDGEPACAILIIDIDHFKSINDRQREAFST